MNYRNLLITSCLSIMMCLITNKVYALDKEENTTIQVKSNVISNIDGKKSLIQNHVIVYEGMVYVAVEDIKNLLGIEVNFKDDMISIQGQLAKENTKEEDIEYEHIDKVIIVEIDSKKNRLAVLSKGESHKRAAHMILHIDDQTKIIHGKLNKEIPLKMLTKGMCVEIKYNGHLNSSNYQPITPKRITVVEDTSNQRENMPIINKGKILEIYREEGYIVVGDIEEEGKKADQVIVYIDNNTNVKSESGDIYTIKALKVGQRIKVYTNGILTNSIPPQTLGLEILILG